jgi:disks large-associated protein 5
MFDLLRAVDFSFKPNEALSVRGETEQVQAQAAASSNACNGDRQGQASREDGFSSMLHASPTTPGLTQRLALATATPRSQRRRRAAMDMNSLNAYLFEDESTNTTPTPPCSPTTGAAAAATTAAMGGGDVKTGKLISLTPMSSTPMHRSRLSRVTSAPAPPPSLSLSPSHEHAAMGGVVRFAQVTPRRQMRELLGTDIVITPVRRSSRLLSRGDDAAVDSINDLPQQLDFGYLPNDNLMN